MSRYFYSMKKLLIFILLIAFSFNLCAQKSKVKHVILMGFDGLGAYGFSEAEAPNIKQLMQDGAWSLQARAVLPSSSAVNWASMLMGAGPTLHGYTEWDSQVPEIPSVDKNRYGIFPTIFGVIKNQRPNAKLGVIYSWGGIGYLFGKNTVDLDVHTNNDSLSAARAIEFITKEKPLFTFVHFDEPDGTGHKIGHRTPEYNAMVHKVDTYVGEIRDAIKEAGMEKETLIILTSDHGGTGKGHGGKSLDEVEIPWIIAGPGVKKNHQITDVIITYDTAATIAYALGLEMPQSWRGKPVLDALIKKK